MSLTSRRPRPLDRTTGCLRDTRLVIIATEGAITERQYFEIFSARHKRVQVKVLESQDGFSAPKHVLARLKQFRNEFELRRGDALCLVVDKDRWGDAQLSSVASQAARLGFELAVSVPCFEVWLYLHHAEPDASMDVLSSQQWKDSLRALCCGYDGLNLEKERFEPHVRAAVDRARALDEHPTDRWPRGLGSHVYRVIDAIEERARS